MIDIEKLLRNLTPLMPEKVAHWQRVRQTAEPSFRQLLDRYILEEAEKRLGKNYQTIYLSLPPASKVKGSLQLGTVIYEAEKWRFGIHEDELLQHLGIFGRSGSGKTNICFLLLQKLAERKTVFLFLDWKRSARHLLPDLTQRVQVITPGRTLSPLSFNPFLIPPGMEVHIFITHIVDILAEAFTLGDGCRSILQKVLSAWYARESGAPTIEDLLQRVETLPNTSRVRDWKVSVVRTLESLAFLQIMPSHCKQQETMLHSFLERSTIIELDALGHNAKRFLIPALVLWLYWTLLEQAAREKLRIVVVLEEAHHLLYRRSSGKESTLEMVFRQAREVGLSFVVLDQHPSLVSLAALNNIYTSICLNQKSSHDRNAAADISMLESSEKRLLNMLPVGHGVVKLQDRWHMPFLVSFPLVNVHKGLVTDSLLRRYLAGTLTRSGMRAAQDGAHGRVRQIRLSDIPLSEDDAAFLSDILRYPDDGVRKRYHRCGWSAGKGTRIKTDLIAGGWVASETIDMGTTRKTILRLTPSGIKVIGETTKDVSRESISHEFWKRYYANLLSRRGYAVEIEAARVGGRVDVMAVKASERVGIEVETGKSDIEKNVRNCLLSDFSRVILVATSTPALEIIERRLGRAGLLLPGRIELYLRDKAVVDSEVVDAA